MALSAQIRPVLSKKDRIEFAKISRKIKKSRFAQFPGRNAGFVSQNTKSTN